MTRRPTVVLTHGVAPEVVDALAVHATVVANETCEALAPDELRRRAARAEALVAFMPDHVDEAFLAGCPHLEIVAGALKGTDNLDVAACTRRGIWVTNVPDLLTAPTADLAIGLAIGLARNVRLGDERVRSGRFSGWRPVLYGAGFAGETAGILGMGAVGRALARRLRSFDAEILYVDEVGLSPDVEKALGARRVDLAELVTRSRYLFPLAPLTAATFHVVDRELLSRVRPGACVVNVGRGSLVDEDAIAGALRSGRLAGYAADVFAMEDLSRTERPHAIPAELLAHPNTLFTPHLGSAVESVRREISLRAAANVIAVFHGKRPPDAVNDPTAEAAERAC